MEGNIGHDLPVGRAQAFLFCLVEPVEDLFISLSVVHSVSLGRIGLNMHWGFFGKLPHDPIFDRCQTGVPIHLFLCETWKLSQLIIQANEFQVSDVGLSRSSEKGDHVLSIESRVSHVQCIISHCHQWHCGWVDGLDFKVFPKEVQLLFERCVVRFREIIVTGICI